MFSIIIPVYNSEKYLGNCIRSIVEQNFKQFEVLLINDGSTDGSADICNKWAQQDSRIKAFHQNNAGVSSARNKGIENATGDYILFVDSDDAVSPNYFASIHNAVKNNDVDLVHFRVDTYCNSMVNSSTFNFKGLLDIKTDTEIFISELKDAYVMTRAYKAKIFKDDFIRFNKSLTLWEDTDFILRVLSRVDSVYILDEPLYNYYINENSTTVKGHLTAHDDALIFLENYDNVMKNLQIHEDDLIVNYRKLLRRKMAYGHFRYICANDKRINHKRYAKFKELFANKSLKDDVLSELKNDENKFFALIYMIILRLNSPLVLNLFIKLKSAIMK